MTKPFADLTGPEFLMLYGAFFVAASAFAAVAHWALRTPADEPEISTPALDPYEIAYLAGGHTLAADAALANLVGRGDMVVHAARQSVSAVRAPRRGAHPLESAVAQNPNPGQVGGDWLISTVRRSARVVLTETHARLIDLGLVVADGPAWAARLVSAFPFFALLTLGLLRLWFGMAQGKPVGFLLFACAVTLIVGIWLLGSRPHCSRRGDRVLATLRRENVALQKAGPTSLGSSGPDLVLAVGLFGASVLAGGPLSELYTALMPPSGSGGDGGGDGGGGGGGGCGG